MRPRKAKHALAIIPPAPVLAIPVGASARLTFLEQLETMRGRIDDAINAVKALG